MEGDLIGEIQYPEDPPPSCNPKRFVVGDLRRYLAAHFESHERRDVYDMALVHVSLT
jgi:hypothetical protein